MRGLVSSPPPCPGFLWSKSSWWQYHLCSKSVMLRPCSRSIYSSSKLCCSRSSLYPHQQNDYCDNYNGTPWNCKESERDMEYEKLPFHSKLPRYLHFLPRWCIIDSVRIVVRNNSVRCIRIELRQELFMIDLGYQQSHLWTYRIRWKQSRRWQNRF